MWKSFLNNQCIASKFAHVLRWAKNGLLKVQLYLSATIFIPPCP